MKPYKILNKWIDLDAVLSIGAPSPIVNVGAYYDTVDGFEIDVHFIFSNTLTLRFVRGDDFDTEPDDLSPDERYERIMGLMQSEHKKLVDAWLARVTRDG